MIHFLRKQSEMKTKIYVSEFITVVLQCGKKTEKI